MLLSSINKAELDGAMESIQVTQSRQSRGTQQAPAKKEPRSVVKQQKNWNKQTILAVEGSKQPAPSKDWYWG